MSTFEDQYGKTFFLKKGKIKKKALPIIGLHGGPGGTHLGLYSLSWLSDERCTVLYDQIGSGFSSELPLNKAKISTFVDNLNNLVNHLNLDRFHLYGASWGTTLALEYFLKHGKKGKIASITFQSPMFSTQVWERDANRLVKKLSPNQQKVIKYCHEINAMDSKVYKEAVKDYYARFVYRLKKRPEWAPVRIPNVHGEKIYNHMWGPSEFFSTGTLKKYDRLADLKKVDVPTLVICGQHDEATPESGKKFAAKMKGEFKMIKGGSHSLLTEKPKETLSALKAFLTKIES